MAAEFIRTELKTTEDRRVRAGLRGAIEWLAARHGMSPAEQREFADEVERECDKAVASRAEAGACCDVVIEEREERVEVKIQSPGRDSRNASLHRTSSAKSADSHATRNGRSGAILVRHFHRSPTHL